MNGGYRARDGYRYIWWSECAAWLTGFVHGNAGHAVCAEGEQKPLAEIDEKESSWKEDGTE